MKKNGHLNIPTNYEIKNVKLELWIVTQRRVLKGKTRGKLTPHQIDLLNQIGMIWDAKKDSWDRKYELAHNYFKEYNNLDIPRSYVTEDGTRLGNWINMNRQAYRKNIEMTISKEQIEKLESIGMIWNIRQYNFLTRTITKNNRESKKKSLLKQLYVLLDELDMEFNSLEDVDYVSDIYIKRLFKTRK